MAQERGRSALKQTAQRRDDEFMPGGMATTSDYDGTVIVHDDRSFTCSNNGCSITLVEAVDGQRY